MSGVYIKGMEMPSIDLEWRIIRGQDGKWYAIDVNAETSDGEWHEIVPVPPHGRLIDADALRQTMYHEAFETDSPMQKWDSGCWIRYKMFEQMEETAPTIIPAEYCVES